MGNIEIFNSNNAHDENDLSFDILTFYEKFLRYLNWDPLLFSLVFGLILFSLHLIASVLEEETTKYLIIKDMSFFLSAMNSVGAYLVISATKRLRRFLANLIHLTKANNSDLNETYKKDFLGNRTLFFAFSFGCINVFFAYLFGVKYLFDKDYYLVSTFFFQIFSIGFIGGITVNATIVIVKLIKKVSFAKTLKLDYLYPDKCAGTLFIGNILFVFAIYFIIIGVMIYFFIGHYEWVNLKSDDKNLYVYSIMHFWKVFPFILSGIVFIVPVKKLHVLLKEYKVNELIKVRNRLRYLTDFMFSLDTNESSTKDEIEFLDNYYLKLKNIDKEISELNTWPYNFMYSSTFLGIFLPITIGIIQQLIKNFNKIIYN
ncbi:hypothetical protein [Flammeovirga sp. SJP92]|uniref:hypothetical protein n=1 Tax=Flammeovirga sp. SJP92 TaxID=1775430 RepID=UPI0007879CE4|nr:hypothetical protein [Flammeovirga sp. SJP92]KXX71924.1 hypothetical protein AVL50_03825 [Flammeovirga sp. SJP92]